MNRVKFDLKTRPQPVEHPDKETCGICKRQVSRYTCPTCNLPYCSLTCFRSEAHSECSETFYRKEIENDIHTTPSKSGDERRKMLELLQKFEEESAQEPDDTAEDGDDDLAQKLEGINLDEADPNDVWSILTPAQRDSFLKAMRNPSGELAQQLLSSAELDKGRNKPWWESPSLDMDETSEDSGAFGTLPRMMPIPQELSTSGSSPRCLVYNILALCVAYAYITRRLSASPLSALDPSDPDRTVAQDTLSQIAPFLTDRISTLLFGNVDSLVTDAWSRLEALSDPPTRDSFAVLLADAAHLFRPQPVSVITEGNLDAQPSRLALLAISDLAELFRPASAKSKHVLHKLNFYAAHLCGQNPDVLKVVAEEARIASLAMHSHPVI